MIVWWWLLVAVAATGALVAVVVGVVFGGGYERGYGDGWRAAMNQSNVPEKGWRS